MANGLHNSTDLVFHRQPSNVGLLADTAPVIPAGQDGVEIMSASDDVAAVSRVCRCSAGGDGSAVRDDALAGLMACLSTDARFACIHRLLDEMTDTGLGRDELEARISELLKIEAHVTERRLAFTAAIDGLGDGGLTAAEVARSRSHLSKRAATRASKTAEKLTEMPRLREALANGEITAAHADAAADAATSVSPAQVDEALVDAAKAMAGDVFANKTKTFAETELSERTKARRYTRQRRMREARTWVDARGMGNLAARFDPVTFAEIRAHLNEAVDRLWRNDNKTNNPDNEHGPGNDAGSNNAPRHDLRPDDVRTPAQRRCDALAELVTAPSADDAHKRPHPRHTVVVTVDAGRLRLDNPQGSACLTDGTELPQGVLEQICCESTFAGAVYEAPGVWLWQSRRIRVASQDQWIALIARDKTCVCCDTPAQYCQAHHIIPFKPPLRGPTNINNMVLICNQDHHLVHDGTHKLAKTPTGWKLQPNQQRPPPNPPPKPARPAAQKGRALGESHGRCDAEPARLAAKKGRALGESHGRCDAEPARLAAKNGRALSQTSILGA